jgi:hypothetical protein
MLFVPTLIYSRGHRAMRFTPRTSPQFKVIFFYDDGTQLRRAKAGSTTIPATVRALIGNTARLICVHKINLQMLCSMTSGHKFCITNSSGTCALLSISIRILCARLFFTSGKSAVGTIDFKLVSSFKFHVSNYPVRGNSEFS